MLTRIDTEQYRAIPDKQEDIDIISESDLLPRYCLIVEFDSETDRDRFKVLVEEWNDGKQKDEDFIAPF